MTTNKQLCFSGNSPVVICIGCGMKYSAHLNAVHKKYHTSVVGGIPWPTSSPISSINFKKWPVVTICRLQRDDKPQLNATKALLNLANQELGIHDELAETASVYIACCRRRALAIVTTVTLPDGAGRWFDEETGRIVPKQVNQGIKVGVERIWVCRGWRRRGIAMGLLRVVEKEEKVERYEIGFSQPGGVGGKLAKRYAGVKHKLGKILVGVYVDENTS